MLGIWLVAALQQLVSVRDMVGCSIAGLGLVAKLQQLVSVRDTVGCSILAVS